MVIFISILLSFIFLLLAIVHMYWALGGYWGKKVAIPAKENNIEVFSPGTLSTFIVAIAFLILIVFLLVKAKIVHLKIPLLINEYAFWIVAAIFVLRAIGEFKYVGFFKKIQHTAFAQYDTKYYSPLSLTIAILLILLELNTH